MLRDMGSERMPSFDFISEADFRGSLERDYNEMQTSIASSSWKSAQVLAGSVVEALLIDYLVSVPNPARTAKNPLQMDLAEAIAICRGESVLSDRTADLCSVVRSFRNLIHPGRVVRLNEPAPSHESASIAMSLVEIIASELARHRRQQVGLTAEQLVSKLERDQDALSIFKHMVMEASDRQKEKLLLELLPKAYAHHRQDVESWDVAARIEGAFEVTLNIVAEATKRKVAAEFVRVLREEDGSYVSEFADAFFRCSALEFVAENQRAMVCGYMLGRLQADTSLRTLKMTEDLVGHLELDEVGKWLDALVKAILSSETSEESKRVARNHISWAGMSTTAEADKRIAKRLQDWKKHYTDAGNVVKLHTIDELLEMVIPF